APGAVAPTKTITPGRGELKPVPPGKDEHQLVRDAAGELAHRASWRAKLFAPGAGAPTRLRQPGERAHRVRSRPVGSTFPPGCSAPALRQPELVQSREGRAPARPRCSRRTRPSSQQARYAVRTRGGCSYKTMPPGEASFSRCRLGRTSTSSSAVQQENFEPPHYAVRTRGGCSYKATMPRRKATMPRRGELIATLHPTDDVIFPILIRHAAFGQHPPGLGDAGLVHGLRISADQVVPRRQIFPFGHQAVGAGRGKPGELRGAGRGQLHAVGHMLAPVGIVTAAAGLEVQQLAGDARVVDSVGVILVLELLQAAQTAAVAQG